LFLTDVPGGVGKVDRLFDPIIDGTIALVTTPTPPSLADAIKEHAAGGYAVKKVVEAVCRCGGRSFKILVDDEAGFASRTCTACTSRVLMLDSADYEDEAKPEECECPCGESIFEVAVGFALRQDGSVKWVSVGLKCVACGQPGVYADWKIDYEPSKQLFKLV
jgi:hypothetical protein